LCYTLFNMFESKKKGQKSFDKFPIYEIKKDEFSRFPLLKNFLEIPDAPKQIFVRGNLNLIKEENNLKFLSIVGSRAVTTYGKDIINKIIPPLSGYPICIISGLAIGVDGLSHTAAIKSGLPIIAIPGSGLGEKVLYPRMNRDLALEILNAGGLLISEYDENFKSTLYAFPARNRLMAALSDAVLLIEAGEKSGTMITARIATEYNKDVWCVPGSIFSDKSKGTNNLIKNGAAMITDHLDILHNFRISVPEEKSGGKNKNVKDLEKMNLSDEEKIILKNLNENLTKEKLMEMCGMEFSEFLTALTMLEMKNLIKEEVGTVRKVI
jgi:DNA processing protein